MEKITLSQVFSDAPKPIYPKFLKPKTFGVLKGEEKEAYKFLEFYNRASEVNAWTDRERIFYFGAYLEGYAKVWYKKFRKNNDNKNKTWDDISENFLEEFVVDLSLYKLRLELKEKKQSENQDILDYFYEILDSAFRISEDFPFEQIVETFEFGLTPDYQYKFALMVKDRVKDLKTLKQIVFKISNAEKRMEIHAYKEINGKVVNQFANNSLRLESVDVKQGLDLFKSQDGKRICFKCRKVGHTRRACKSKIIKN